MPSPYERARKFSSEPTERDKRFANMDNPFTADQYLAHHVYDKASNEGKFQGENGGELEGTLWNKVVDSHMPAIDLTDPENANTVAAVYQHAIKRHGDFLDAQYGK